MWPIVGADADELDANFRDFCVEALLVPDTVVRNASITDIIRVRNSPQSSIYSEVLVSFGDYQERNYYHSKARNLAEFRDDKGAPTAGIRLDIPPFLMGTFKSLSDHGYAIKAANGRETRRYIKYDDDNPVPPSGGSDPWKF